MQLVKIPSLSGAAALAAGGQAEPFAGDEPLLRALARARYVIGDAVAPPEERMAVEAALCGHIAVLAPRVRTQADALWHGGTEWDRLAARLDDIAHLTCRPLRESQPAARAHLAELARACQWLFDRVTAHRRTPGANG
ncbi:DUF6415 family natural product biosynthesis protein [Streptomyces sp. NPDC018045]|uniref:DUF6415 family natural product biosynthesis protein n=1 Tax=Streptomyces sp. NPDC018045 TaxID=3365037 RepID=UPI00379CBB7F